MTWERIEQLLQEFAHVARSFYKTLASESVGRLEQDLTSIRESMYAIGKTLSTLPKAPANVPASLIEYAAAGDQLESSTLCGEFLSNSHDIVLWAESMEGPKDTVARFEHKAGLYQAATSSLGRLIPYATRIRATPEGGLICIQERADASYLPPGLTTSTVGVRMPIDGDPIIRSEVVHPTRPIAIFGTDYGMLVAWDWSSNSILFCKRYFPRKEIVWMTALSVDTRADLVQFVEGNQLYEVRMNDGEVVRKLPLGPPEETGKCAFHSQTGLLAVGGLMHTRLYRLDPGPTLIWEIQNPLPLVQQVCFSPNGRLLSVLTGMGLGGTALMIVGVNSGRVTSRHGQVWPPKNMSSKKLLSLSIRWVSFSSASDLLAIGEGGRVGIYKCPTDN